MKRNKNRLSIKITFCLALTFVIAIFCMAILSLKTYDVSFAENTNSNFGRLLNVIDISQEGHRFEESDFTQVQENSSNIYEVYTNKNVTIKNDGIVDITINGAQRGSDHVKLFHYPANSESPDYYIFKVSDISGIDTSYTIQLSANVSTGTEGLSTTVSATIRIIQTKTNFNDFYASSADNGKKIMWQYKDKNNINQTVILPENNATYSALSLTFPYGTEKNPIYVNFVYMGQNYVISRYKTESESIVTKNEVTNTELSIDTLTFDKSGVYEVSIYDKTSTEYNKTNMQKCLFTIVNPESPFYFMITNSETNAVIMNQQYTNSNVDVKYENIDKIQSQIDHIQVLKTYQPNGGSNITDRATFSLNQIENCSKFTEDGAYIISLIRRDNSIYARYAFTILQEVKGSITIGTQTTTSNQPANVIQTVETSVKISSTYNNEIETVTTNNFNVFVASNDTGIDGISNNERTSNSVNLTVKGVGEIEVYATLNGNYLDLGKTTFENGDKLPTLSEKGTYYFRITDQMGIRQTKSFTITVKLNVASILLIVFSAIVLLIIVIYIIRSRSRIKVR